MFKYKNQATSFFQFSYNLNIAIIIYIYVNTETHNYKLFIGFPFLYFHQNFYYCLIYLLFFYSFRNFGTFYLDNPIYVYYSELLSVASFCRNIVYFI